MVYRKINHLPDFYFGPFGVSLFFLISGFVIPYSLFNVPTKIFAWRRFLRIYPLFWIAFLLNVSIIYWSGFVNGVSFPYRMREIVFNCLPGIRDCFNSKSIDGIICTLDIEVKFYVICILFKKWLKDRRILLLPFVLFSVQYLLKYSSSIGLEIYNDFRFISFILIGTFYYLMREKKISSEFGIFSILIVFGALTMTANFIPERPEFWGQSYLWAQGFALLCFFGVASFPQLFQSKGLRFLADISYPLYLTHAISGYAIMTYLHIQGMNPLMTALLGISVVIVIGWIYHRLFERPILNFSKQFSQVKATVE